MLKLMENLMRLTVTLNNLLKDDYSKGGFTIALVTITVLFVAIVKSNLQLMVRPSSDYYKHYNDVHESLSHLEGTWRLLLYSTAT